MFLQCKSPRSFMSSANCDTCFERFRYLKYNISPSPTLPENLQSDPHLRMQHGLPTSHWRCWESTIHLQFDRSHCYVYRSCVIMESCSGNKYASSLWLTNGFAQDPMIFAPKASVGEQPLRVITRPAKIWSNQTIKPRLP